MAYPHESKYKEEERWGEKGDCHHPPDFEEVKSSNRPKIHCKPVTCKDTLTGEAPVTFLSTLDVAGETNIELPQITVGGLTFVPTVVQLCIGISGGGGTVGPDGGSVAPPTPIMGSYTLLVAQNPGVGAG